MRDKEYYEILPLCGSACVVHTLCVYTRTTTSTHTLRSYALAIASSLPKLFSERDLWDAARYPMGLSATLYVPCGDKCLFSHYYFHTHVALLWGGNGK